MARCGCGSQTATGCECLLTNSNCFSWDGDGSELDPFTISPILDVNVNNLLTCGVDGLLAQLPSYITNRPAVSVYRSNNQSISNNSMTVVTFNTEAYDTDTMHSLVSNTGRITFTTAGNYTVTFYGIWDKNSTGNRAAEIRKNGTDVLAYESKKAGGSDLYVGHCVIAQDDFIATDYVEALVFQTSGSSLSLLSEYGSPNFSAELV